jgi:hypothetical protein
MTETILGVSAVVVVPFPDGKTDFPVFLHGMDTERTRRS